MVAIGGVIWLTSGGNPQKIGQAKSYIVSAVIGIILLMGSYLILSNINSDLVNLDGINVMVLTEKEYGCCQVMDGDTYIEAFSALEDECTSLKDTYVKKFGNKIEISSNKNYSPSLDGKKCEENVCGIINYTKSNYTTGGYYGAGVTSYETYETMCMDANEEVIDKIKTSLGENSLIKITSFKKLNDQLCSSLSECNEHTTSCLNADYGDLCSNFAANTGLNCYCYDGIQYLGKAGEKEPCGNDNQGLSRCEKVSVCGSDERKDNGGRPCADGLRCCRPKK